MKRSESGDDRVMLVTTVKDEGPNILEWVCYHRMIGFTDIVVFQNDSFDTTERTLWTLQEMGVIRYFNNNFRKPWVRANFQNRAYRRAVEKGCDPLIALQMATINTATHFGLERELGSITPGRRADLILSSDLTTLPIELVIAHGQVMAENGKLVVELPKFTYPEFARNTVHVGRTLGAKDFEIAAPKGANKVEARVIGVIENQAPTKALQRPLVVKSGLVEMDHANDVCQIAVVERHRGLGTVVNAFVSGFGYNVECAVASTVAHDSHHIIVVGTNHDDMALAANTLSEIGGGVVVVSKGKELARVELVVAGLMSDEPAEIVAAKAEKMIAAMKACGCNLNNAFMQHSLLALVVIPELRISDMGLIDVRTFEKVDLFVQSSR